MHRCLLGRVLLSQVSSTREVILQSLGTQMSKLPIVLTPMKSFAKLENLHLYKEKKKKSCKLSVPYSENSVSEEEATNAHDVMRGDFSILGNFCRLRSLFVTMGLVIRARGKQPCSSCTNGSATLHPNP